MPNSSKMDICTGLLVLIILAYGSIFFYIRYQVRKNHSNQNSSFEKLPVQKNNDGNVESLGIEKTVKIPILMYHYVEYNQNKDDFLRDSINIEPHVFDKQIKTLKDAGYTSITPREIPEILAKSLDSPDENKYIIISFDDGFRDFYTDAFPIIQKYGVRVVVYIVPYFLNKQNYMYDGQVRKVLKSGLVELGSHTTTHKHLANLPRESQLGQLNSSKDFLEDKFNTSVESFAYPYGVYDDVTVKLVKEVGYTNAVTTDLGCSVSVNNLYEISRIRPGYLTGVPLINYIESLCSK